MGADSAGVDAVEFGATVEVAGATVAGDVGTGTAAGDAVVAAAAVVEALGSQRQGTLGA